MSVAGKDVREGVEREDKRLRDKLLDVNFVNHDNRSRPCNPAYAEGWDRIFGKKQERFDNVDDVTPEPRTVNLQLNFLGDPGHIEHVEVPVNSSFTVDLTPDLVAFWNGDGDDSDAG